MTDQYTVNEQHALDVVAGCRGAIPELVSAANYYWAANNYRRMAEIQTELGLLHWRRGLDPRPDFEGAIDAYENLYTMAREQNLEKRDYECPLVYATLSLMGCTVAIEFDDEDAHEEYRLPCCECCLVHALHDQPLNERHARLLDKYFAEYGDVPQQSYLTYFQLLGLRPSERTRDELVQAADSNWLRREGDKSFSEGISVYGHGVMNKLYVDIYLAAVLKKIGWQGGSLHRWKWG